MPTSARQYSLCYMHSINRHGHACRYMYKEKCTLKQHVHLCTWVKCSLCGGDKQKQHRGSPQGHRNWNQIHWYWIPDPDSIWSHVSSTLHVAYMHWTAGLDLTHCSGVLSCSTAASSPDPDWGRAEGKWSLNWIRIQSSVWRALLSFQDHKREQARPRGRSLMDYSAIWLIIFEHNISYNRTYKHIVFIWFEILLKGVPLHVWLKKKKKVVNISSGTAVCRKLAIMYCGKTYNMIL